MQQTDVIEMETATLNLSIHNDLNQYQSYENDCLLDVYRNAVEYNYCVFDGCQLQDVTFENSYFINVIFKDCDLSNIRFHSSLFRKTKFVNCKLMGTDFAESLFDDVRLKDCQCHFANFSMMKNKIVSFDNCDFTQASFIETQLKKTKFKECSFYDCEVFHSSLYHVDLSSCDLTHIITSLEDISGAIINRYQAESLIHLLKVQIKD